MDTTPSQRRDQLHKALITVVFVQILTIGYQWFQIHRVSDEDYSPYLSSPDRSLTLDLKSDAVVFVWTVIFIPFFSQLFLFVPLKNYFAGSDLTGWRFPLSLMLVIMLGLFCWFGSLMGFRVSWEWGIN